jgi:hypothetical protein
VFAFIRPVFILTTVLAVTLTLGGCALPPPDSRVESQVLSLAQAADTRSTNINTEIGFSIESPKLATAMEESFAEGVPQSAYELGLDNDDLLWVERHDGKQIRHDHEPETGPFKRFWVALLSFLPLESLL